MSFWVSADRHRKMPPVPSDRAQTVQSSSSPIVYRGTSAGGSRFSSLRGVRWRIHLGILPSSADASIDDLRRVAADSRRRYAILRRRLLIDPHIYKDGSKSPDCVIDNPLSQNPDSMWGRFFQNAELERVVDQDLSRLYPEEGSYFQTPTCQAMLRKVLLLWCLRHPEYGYRQGMHELLAPLLYVLHIDVQCLSQVRKLHEDQFNDEFDARSFSESETMAIYGFRSTSCDGENGIDNFQAAMSGGNGLVDLDPETRNIILLSDAYGAEGELGILLSERFMEHDAYCMFDALMNGAHGVVAVADFFSLSPTSGSCTGLTPVIEASSALYHLLYVVDPPLHNHLIELGVEPQYFALRWLRVLFGREFSLQDLLSIWDEVFSSSNTRYHSIKENEAQSNFRILCSPRGAFISAMAVSMILHLRSSLLATENATTCLQRLLNFPDNINVEKLIDKAKSLQVLAVEINNTPHTGYPFSKTGSVLVRSYSGSAGSVSPKTYAYSLPDSYWEEKWRVLHETEEFHKECQRDLIPEGASSRSLSRGRFSLFRAESDPSAGNIGEKKDIQSTVRRRLFNNSSQEGYSEVSVSRVEDDTLVDSSYLHYPVSVESDKKNKRGEASPAQDHLLCVVEETCLSGDNSSLFSTATSPLSLIHDQENASENSSVNSNSCAGDDEGEANFTKDLYNTLNSGMTGDLETTSAVVVIPKPAIDVKQELSEKEKRPASSKFQWIWKFGRGVNEGSLDKGNADAQRSTVGNIQKDIPCSSLTGCGCTGRPEVGDKKMMGTLKNLRQAMRENIQVLESIFQQERGQAGSLENLSSNILGAKGQATAMAALKELRKINNLLFEM